MSIAVGIQTVAPWSVVTPTVYRIMPAKYVDEFFASGQLRLSSFAYFAQHSDEERKDPGEGKHVLFCNAKDYTLVAVTAHGVSAYVLCGTCIGQHAMFECFGSQAAIRINRTTEFGMAVARHVPGFHSGLEGACVYTAAPVEADIDGPELEKLKAQIGEKKVDLGVVTGLINEVASTEVYLRKGPSYKHQAEYRWIWNTKFKEANYIDVTVPEARQFCTRVNAAELDRWSNRERSLEEK